ncbi:MAG: adenylyltransferase/cytidyltransferase family protein [Candidatus Iainarchaeum archaeon]|uniref:Adenylyltransferase/cytidyltransferase family protein n=1 Tax=Candidatus Iainarchaeum sp. TaxID=3101447 RepID=A0A7T9I1N4_9ARCH|nr:MAG: adenylyltransferase/cytidyltransferase family protein [Candidatus Diapherotrites archaeon]
MGKVVSLAELRKHISPCTATLTGGFYDMLHVGHVFYLERAAKLGRPLIVVVNTDKAAMEKKGQLRPIIPEKFRARMVASLGCVDYVIISNHASYSDYFLKAIQPKHYVFVREKMDVRQKQKKEIEKKYPRTKVVIIPRIKKYGSTTELIARIKQEKL